VPVPFEVNSFLFWLPWILLGVALGGGFWLRRRHRAELNAAQAQSSERLAKAQTMLRRISQAVESTSDAVGIGDMEGNSLYHNRAHLEMFDYTVDELNAVPEVGVLFADKKIAQEILLSAKAGHSWRGETDILTKSGQRIPAFVRADIIRDEAGQPVGVYGVFADVSERRRIDRLLEEERARLKVTLQSIGDGVITTDMGGCVVLMNPVAEKLSGWTQSAASGYLLQEVLPLLDEQSRRPLENPALRMIRSGGKDRRIQTSVLMAPDGSERFVTESTAFIRSSDGGMAGIVQVLRDVTDERKRAAEAARAGKLESLGLLAGGIAHDFNNLLTAMAGNLSLARMEPGLTEFAAQRLGEIDKIVWRARDLTEGLKTFAKGGTPRKKRTLLQNLIRETAGLALQGTQTKLELNLPDELRPVEADGSQLGQVMHNIILNGAQAMSLGGRIVITAANLAEGDDAGIRPGQSWIKVSIADDGPGISAEALPKIFDPFFTTKPKGTGLGLATSSSIVEGHGGKLRVESVIGRGTTFHILLPTAPERPEVAGDPNRRRVLLIEDDRSVSDSIELVLTRLNYATVSMSDGSEACKHFKEEMVQNRKFDAVLVDLGTPGDPGGAQTIRQLRRMDARLCVIACSGSDGEVMTDPKRFGFSAAIAKPFKMEELGGLLAGLLAKN
jgi:PAS domain S-box-containing protein